MALRSADTARYKPQALARSLWSDTAAPFTGGDRLRGGETAQVAIIGGGYSGLSAALHLAEAGYAVTVLEAVEPGAGASGRNAAGWMPHYLDRTPASVEQLLGQARGSRLNSMIADAGRLLPEIVARHGLQVDLRESGILVASGNPDEANAARLLRDEWNARSGDVDFIGTDRVRALTGTDRFSHGVLFKQAGTLNPLAYARELAVAASRVGARIYCGEPALHIGKQGDNWRVSTVSGHIDAGRVLIATEGYNTNAALWPGLEKTYYGLPMAIVASDPVPEIAARIMPAGIPIADSNKANPFWTMADAEGRIVASMLPPRADQAAAAYVAQDYETKLSRLHPDLPPIPWSHFWIGTVAVSAERVPCLRKLADGIYALGGYSGQGIAAATAAGREYAALISAGDAQDACRLPILDPKAVPLRRAFPWALRSIAAPLGRRMDRSYQTLPASYVED